MDSIPVIQPLSFKTPILEVEADYGNPIVDWVVIFSILISVYAVKKVIDKYFRKGG